MARDYPPNYLWQAVEPCDLRRDSLPIPAKRDTFSFATCHRLNEENWFPVNQQPFPVGFFSPKPTGC